MDSFQKNFHSPELFGDFWINSDPVSVRDMRGNVFLIDFWNFSSYHSLRSLPYTKDWLQKYRDYGLITVGVHTPEFSFGKEEHNVRKAVENLEISYPVVGDNEARIGMSFGCRTIPTKFLVDKDGFIRFIQQGEGSYEQFERSIQFLLTEAGMRGELPQLTNPIRETDVSGAVCYRTTGEFRTGYLRGALGNIEGYSPESTLEYRDLNMYLPGRFYLDGKWNCERECVRFSGARREEGTVSVRYEASGVNAVLGTTGKKGKVWVQQDGKWLDKKRLGEDVSVAKDGSTYVTIDRSRLFNIVRNPEFGEHAVRLLADAPGVQVYSFSFITSVIPEIVNANTHGIGLN